MSDYTFRRIRGRIVPIKLTQKQKDAAGYGAAGAGGLIAADAARTKRIYDKGGITIDRKKFAMQPFVYDSIGDRLTLKVNGVKAGTASTYSYMEDGKKIGAFSWLGIKRQFRGGGYSKLLSKEAGRNLRSQGAESLFNQVVHAGSLKTNFSSKRDTLWRITDASQKKVGLKKALANINYYRNKKGIYTSDIFRETSLKGIHTSSIKPFRTMGNKIKLAAGLAVTAAAAAYLLRGRDGK